METANLRPRRRAASRARSKTNQKPTSSANALAFALTENATASNMDLNAEVAGYTHRGGFKLRITNIEELSDNLIDGWKSKCRSHGYECTIAYNAALSAAVLHAVKTTNSHSLIPEDVDVVASQVSTGLRKPHPLTILAALLFVANFGRHFFSD